MLQVKILGSGCPNCQKLERETRAALDNAGITYELSKITDFADIAAYGVMQTPALVMNEVILSSGKFPKHAKIVTWAQEHETV